MSLANFSADPENSMIFIYDMLLGGVSTSTTISPGQLNIFQAVGCNGSTAASTVGSLFYGSLTNCSTNYSTLSQPSA